MTGWFEVAAIETATTAMGWEVRTFTASFEQHCEGGDPKLRGCVHYQR